MNRTRAMDLPTITYVLRVIAAGLGVIFAGLLFYEAVSDGGAINKGKIAALAIGSIISASIAAILIFNAPDS